MKRYLKRYLLPLLALCLGTLWMSYCQQTLNLPRIQWLSAAEFLQQAWKDQGKMLIYYMSQRKLIAMWAVIGAVVTLLENVLAKKEKVVKGKGILLHVVEYLPVFMMVLLSSFLFKQWMSRYNGTVSRVLVRTILILTLSEALISWIQKMKGDPQQNIYGWIEVKLPVLRQVLFGVSLLVIYVYQFLRTTMVKEMDIHWDELGMIYRWFLLVMAVLAITAISRTEERKVQVVKTLILFAGFVHWYLTGNALFFSMFITVIAATGLKVKKLMYLCLLIGVGIMILAHYLSLEGYIAYIVRSGEKHAFGSIHNLDYAAHCLMLMILYVVLRKKHLHFYSFILLYIPILMDMRYVKARADLALMILVLAGTVVVWIFEGSKFHIPDKLAKVMTWAFVIMEVVILCMCFFYRDTIGMAITNRIPSMTTGVSRFRMAHQAMMEYYPRLWGSNFHEAGFAGASNVINDYFVVDSMYAHLFVKEGLAVLAAFIGMLTWLLRRAYKTKQYFLVFLMAVIALAGFSEFHIRDLCYNMLPLLLFAADGVDANIQIKSVEHKEEVA